MTGEQEPYPTASGVESAIKEAAKKAAQSDPSLDVNKRIKLEYFNRFLSRIFSEGEASEWVLKGGTGMLARVPSARSTVDIDLFRQGFSPDQALEDLRRLASIELDDHFRFEYAGHESSLEADSQPYTHVYRVSFKVFIGVAGRGTLKIDLAVGEGMTGTVQTMLPVLALPLPRLSSNPYRLFPVVHQIADKVCAIMSDYGGRPSSREKDLVDIVVLALTQNIVGEALTDAIDIERRRRKMEPIDRFAIPGSWGNGYAKLSAPIPYCSDYRTVDRAFGLASRLIDPALAGDARGKTWTATRLKWK